MLRDLGLILLSILVDRTVTLKIPSLVPMLPFAWVLVAVWFTREIIDKTALRNWLIGAYSRHRGKSLMLFYGAVFIVGGVLLCAYVWGLRQAFKEDAPAISAQDRSKTVTVPQEPQLEPSSPESVAPSQSVSPSPSPTKIRQFKPLARKTASSPPDDGEDILLGRKKKP